MTIHKPVLLKEAIENLNLKKGDVVVDATLGGGGHSREMLNKIGSEGTSIAFDLDIEAIKRFAEIPNVKLQIPNQIQNPKSKIQKFDNIYLINGNFAELKNILAEIRIEKVNAVLVDLGWSSDQLSGRGMSFLIDEELDMRYDQRQELTAKKIANEYSKEDLEKIIKKYGEEKFARNISERIIEYRKNKKIETTKELAEIIGNSIPKKFQTKNINPATKTFQALRIETNKELENLEKFIPQAIEMLATGGRLGIITFHSLEDRIVKNSFRENAGGCICPPDFPQCICGRSPKVKIITKKPIASEESEVRGNLRARSAKLRVAEKI